MKIIEAKVHYRIVQDGPPAYVAEAEPAIDYVIEALRDNPLQEQHWVITMTTLGEAIARHLIAVGPMEGAAVSIRDMLRASILDGAYCFTYVHNHPMSSVAIPSRSDREGAQKIARAGLEMNVTLYDMIIVAGPLSEGPMHAYSFRKSGWPDVKNPDGSRYYTGPEVAEISAFSADINGKPHGRDTAPQIQ